MQGAVPRPRCEHWFRKSRLFRELSIRAGTERAIGLPTQPTFQEEAPDRLGSLCSRPGSRRGRRVAIRATVAVPSRSESGRVRPIFRTRWRSAGPYRGGAPTWVRSTSPFSTCTWNGRHRNGRYSATAKPCIRPPRANCRWPQPGRLRQVASTRAASLCAFEHGCERATLHLPGVVCRMPHSLVREPTTTSSANSVGNASTHDVAG